MTAAIRRWLHRKASRELQQAISRTDETQRMLTLYAARNRGEDGYTPGIWYQELEFTAALSSSRDEIEFLRLVVKELEADV